MEYCIDYCFDLDPTTLNGAAVLAIITATAGITWFVTTFYLLVYCRH